MCEFVIISRAGPMEAGGPGLSLYTTTCEQYQQEIGGTEER